MEVHPMTAWSDYLREQALVADRVAGSMTTPETKKEFADIAASYRRDADIEEGKLASTDPLSRLPRRRAGALSTAVETMHG